MTTRQKYWLTEPSSGQKAFVEGAAERDRWQPLGWSETDEPADTDMVWAQHEETKGRALFGYGILRSVWSAKGWQPSQPPEPASPFNSDQIPEPAAAPLGAPAAAEQPDTTKNQTAAGGDAKEKSRA